MFRRNKPAPAVTNAGSKPRSTSLEALTIVPFNLETCTLLDKPTAEEEAALDAHVRACPTREDFWDRAPSADWMLELLRTHPLWIPIVPELQLRRFALRCVDAIDDNNGQEILRLLDVVRQRVNATATLKELEQVQEAARSFVAAGGVQGLPRCIPRAAAALAAWHAADANPYEAAFWTAEFSARHDAFVVVTRHAASCKGPDEGSEAWRESWRASYFVNAHPQIYRRALTESRRRQADVLRSILPHPFLRIGPPIRGEVYFRDEDKPGALSVYCLRCGAGLTGAFPGVLFDVRGTGCAGCRRPLDGHIN